MRYPRLRVGVVIAGLTIAITTAAAAYGLASLRLSEARQARREDDFGQAEQRLAACWRFPGLRREIALEVELLAVQQGDLSDETAWRSRATGRSSESNLILEALAKGNLATFQWQAAQQDADAVLDRQPGDARALWLRGKALVAMQQEEQARHDLERARQQDPESYAIRRSLADLLHKIGFTRSAIGHYVALLQLRPGDESAALALAHCWQEEARPQEALGLIESLLSTHPASVRPLLERGRLEFRFGDPAAAEQWLRRAVALRPEHVEANRLLRLSLEAQKKDDAALRKHLEACELRQAELKSRLGSSPEAAVLAEVGQWMLASGKEEEAAGWFYAALKAEAGQTAAHRGLAEVFRTSGQLRRASRHERLAGVEPRPVLKPAALPTAKHNGGALEDKLASTPEVELSEARAEDVQRLCAVCHAYPAPETMPRHAWRKEVKQGYDFLRASALAGDFPSLESVVLYYERRAPERLRVPTAMTPAGQPPVQFAKRGTGWLPRLPPRPAIANAALGRLLGTEHQELLLCDTRLDAVLVLRPYAAGPGGMVLRDVPAPCHAAVCDLDGNSHQDLIVASLGSFLPTDDRVGKILWLRGSAEGQFAAKTILEGVGRVADVQAADFNLDGRLDLVVAAFGWRETGEILYLENRTSDWNEPQFAAHTVDSRHGAIHVPVVDLNGDGRPDFVALISQEHEAVVAYLNQNDGTFRRETIYTAPHPAFGVSGIEVVDLDGDGDFDVLLTNGDILDRPYLLKPYHGIQWLENEGSFPFTPHQLATMPGAARAVAADFDGDGDRDVAAVSFLPASLFPERKELGLPAVVLLEQQAKGRFVLHVLERESCDHFSCAAGDWDGDGRIDLAVANFSWDESQPLADAAVLWRNVGPAPAASGAGQP